MSPTPSGWVRWMLAIAGAAAIAGVGISTGQEIAAYAVFVLVATICVGARRHLLRTW
jgi:hypothetical protein